VNPGAEAEAIRAASCLSQGVCESDYLRYDLEYLCFFVFLRDSWSSSHIPGVV